MNFASPHYDELVMTAGQSARRLSTLALAPQGQIGTDLTAFGGPPKSATGIRAFAGRFRGVSAMPVLLWILLIGFVAGIIARLVTPGANKPKGFVLTTALGVAGALVATLIGDAVGLYRPHQGAGLIGATGKNRPSHSLSVA